MGEELYAFSIFLLIFLFYILPALYVFDCSISKVLEIDTCKNKNTRFISKITSFSLVLYVSLIPLLNIVLSIDLLKRNTQDFQ